MGVDGVTKEQYGQNLEANLQDLHARLKAKQYRHQPIRQSPHPQGSGQDAADWDIDGLCILHLLTKTFGNHRSGVNLRLNSLYQLTQYSGLGERPGRTKKERGCHTKQAAQRFRDWQPFRVSDFNKDSIRLPIFSSSLSSRTCMSR